MIIVWFEDEIKIVFKEYFLLICVGDFIGFLNRVWFNLSFVILYVFVNIVGNFYVVINVI